MSKLLDTDVCVLEFSEENKIQNTFIFLIQLSLEISGPKGREFESLRRCGAVFLSKVFYPHCWVLDKVRLAQRHKTVESGPLEILIKSSTPPLSYTVLCACNNYDTLKYTCSHR